MTKYVTIETDKGTIKAELYAEKAPITTKNFIELANSGFYNGLKFHRVEKDFVIQGGDPKGDGTGGSGKNIPLEINSDLRHTEGAVAMARSQDPDSASSQFYITLAPTPFLDGNYAVFGKVIYDMDIVKKIEVGDKMNKVYITDK
ncbi:MAG TPA: peptidylprolyl isomerase [Candidatus Nanoarchaeia archaeon]|nr:peptidylprolyl isomerase [Candidatus Nanoarchaeia archaeon]